MKLRIVRNVLGKICFCEVFGVVSFNWKFSSMFWRGGAAGKSDLKANLLISYCHNVTTFGKFSISKGSRSQVLFFLETGDNLEHEIVKMIPNTVDIQFKFLPLTLSDNKNFISYSLFPFYVDIVIIQGCYMKL